MCDRPEAPAQGTLCARRSPGPIRLSRPALSRCDGARVGYCAFKVGGAYSPLECDLPSTAADAAAPQLGDVRRDPPRFVARMSLVRDERHDRMDKKNDHSRKHGQRDSFIDACAAKDCDAFHSFPPSRRQCESRRAVTLHCFGERGVKGCAANSGSLAMFAAMRRAFGTISADDPGTNFSTWHRSTPFRSSSQPPPRIGWASRGSEIAVRWPTVRFGTAASACSNKNR